ncbi:MAG: hypothetical protein ABII06_10885 [Pseudomonadota bacterium]
MMKKKLAMMMILIFGTAMVLASCAALQKPTASNFKNPVITLEEFMVPQYDGYWYYSGKTKATQGKDDDRGAPLPMTFLFNIQNPNPYPVLLDGFKFTVAFDKEFSLVTVNNQDAYWIPAGKTDQVRATTMITVRSALLSLMVTAGFTLKEKNWTPWQALERWWKGVPEYTVPVTVHEGSFTFTADGVTRTLPFKAEIP